MRRPMNTPEKLPADPQAKPAHPLLRLDGNIMFAQPVEKFRLRYGKFGADFGAITTGTHQPAVRTFAQHAGQRINENRFTGTRFPRQHAETRLKIQFETIDQDEIPDTQTI